MQASQDEPQVEGLVSLTHLPLHRWLPVLQDTPHVPPMHAAAPLASPGQAVHAEPQAVASSSRAHRSPQR
jgi:hypothetical protein